MRIHGSGGDIPIKLMTFTDGQQHVEILGTPEDPQTTIEAAISTSADLMNVVLAKDALDTFGGYVDLDIRYLLGARMDRRIALGHPLTLEVVARILLGCGFRRIRVLDPHSPKSLELLDATAVLPVSIIHAVLNRFHPKEDVIVMPDAGAVDRVPLMVGGEGFALVACRKHRNSATGEVGQFEVLDPGRVRGKGCLIVDDLCDGGRTFIGQAEVLRAAGATAVSLYVTHGIFSHGLPLDGIDRIYTTDSFAGRTSDDYLRVYSVLMSLMEGVKRG